MVLIILEVVDFHIPELRNCKVCWLIMSTDLGTYYRAWPRVLFNLSCFPSFDEVLKSCVDFDELATLSFVCIWVSSLFLGGSQQPRWSESCNMCSEFGPHVLVIFPEFGI